VTIPPRQLTLDWPHEPSFAREDFLPAPSNREALAAIDRWPDWPGRMLLMAGPHGAGKSHLASLWAQKSAAIVMRGEALAGLDASLPGEAFLIEDADRVGSGEAELFHLLNAAMASRAWLLMTARSAPEAWAVTTPDLLSRLRLAPIVRLETPDVDLIEAVLFKLFSDRQLQVEPNVAAYIAQRIDRSIGAARDIVALLDREALARGRPVTRAMAGELLRAAGDAAEGG
jgi:chromosomal replication initiation ATPase DnaA